MYRFEIVLSKSRGLWPEGEFLSSNEVVLKDREGRVLVQVRAQTRIWYQRRQGPQSSQREFTRDWPRGEFYGCSNQN